ncbi:UPF0481 protein At3g47200-like [Elaeis guineensis]|uniref:UPF0481 protein At3g47200-like n=1 Tax=Elaeis guineensis var. tenera TaxID=51953 RepID=A0A6I9SFN8_ELAGV|nr:UPF0481 protein At3g47200-like [Elaeis guineensis]XP_010942588.1 UPF0481 protein At3g47200-like [Elaeis guineensis]
MDRGYRALSSSEKTKGKEKAETMEASKIITVEGEDKSSAAGGLSFGDIRAYASQRDEATDDLAKKMQKKIEDVHNKPHNYTAPKNISSVPASTDDHDKKLYEPRAVAIGPYYRNMEDNNFDITYEHKLWCAEFIIGDCNKKNLAKFLGEMKKKEKAARDFCRQSYKTDYPNMDPQSFLEMLMLDSCFVLLVLSFHFDVAKVVDQFAIQLQGPMPWALRDVVRASEFLKTDLLLRKNQIPYFIIVDAFKMVKEVNQGREPIIISLKEKGSITEVAFEFFDTLGLGWSDFPLGLEKKVDSLLHLYYLSLGPKSLRSLSLIEIYRANFVTLDPRRSIPSATELQEKSAMKFKAEKKAHSVLDVTCKNGVIRMPALHVYDFTDILLHNLIGYEQPLSTMDSYITAYVAFMVRMVRKEGDVELLENSGVLEHGFTDSAEVVAFFRQLHNVIDRSKTPGYLDDLYTEVTNSYKNPWRRMYADAKKRYCSSVWVSITVVAGVVLSVLTLIETIYAIIGFYQS